MIGIIIMIISSQITIIGGVLMGMFFMYPLGHVVPDEHYIDAFIEEYGAILSLIVLGVILLVVGSIFLIASAAPDSER
jgi:hypothetical protein